MDKTKIEAVMAERLKLHGLTADDLTEAELEQLREEVEFELNGGAILDGVLSSFGLCGRCNTKDFEESKQSEEPRE